MAADASGTATAGTRLRVRPLAARRPAARPPPPATWPAG